jgi:hypothetical protein
MTCPDGGFSAFWKWRIYAMRHFQKAENPPSGQVIPPPPPSRPLDAIQPSSATQFGLRVTGVPLMLRGEQMHPHRMGHWG